LLTEHGSQGSAMGTGPSKHALEGRGEGDKETVGHLNALADLVRHDTGAIAPIDGSREVDLDWIHDGCCCCWFCCWSRVRAQASKSPVSDCWFGNSYSDLPRHVNLGPDCVKAKEYSEGYRNRFT